MTSKKVVCDDAFCKSFIADAKKTCEKYGIKMEDVNPELLKKCQQKNCSVEECRNMLQKSKCCSSLDFSAY